MAKGQVNRMISMPKHAQPSIAEADPFDNSYLALFELIPEPILFIDPSGTILDANPACKERFQRFGMECIGVNLFEMTMPDPLQQLKVAQRKTIAQEVFRTGKSTSFEDMQNGSIWKHSLYPIISPEGEVVKLCIMDRDITPQRNVELQYRDIQSQFDFTLQNYQLGVWGIDLRDNSIHHTLEHDRIFGYDTLVPQWNFEIFVSHVIPEDRQDVEQKYWALIDNPDGWSHEFRIRRVDGSVRWIHDIGGCEMDENGKAIRVLGVTRDITELKEAELKLRDFDQKWDFISRNGHIGLWSLDLDTLTLSRTEAHARIYGEDFSSQPTWNLQETSEHIFIDDRQRVSSVVQKALSDHQDYQFEARIYGADSTIRWIHVIGVFKFDEQGTARYILGTTQDITALKELEIEQQILETKLQQSQKMELLGQLAGGIAHDFNNSLTAILGNIEIAQEIIDENNPAYENLVSISHSAMHSAETVKQLLAFARKKELTPQSVLIDDELKKMRILLGNLIRENVEFRWNLNSHPHLVSLDPSCFVQIITNLCVNARDAISDRGIITIETDIVNASDYDWMTANNDAPVVDLLRISISDSGCGISQKALPHIFEPFFTTKEIGKGTGLGLSTVYGLVNQNGGVVTCQSEIDKGTTFSILFPLSQITDTKQESTTVELPEITSNGLVLVVEDQPQILSIITLILQKQGLKVLSAENAEEAIRIFEAHENDIGIVISDIMMAGMNGIQMSHEIMKMNPCTKFIFMSGYTADALGSNARLDADTKFISKPFGVSDFLRIVKSVLN